MNKITSPIKAWLTWGPLCSQLGAKYSIGHRGCILASKTISLSLSLFSQFCHISCWQCGSTTWLIIEEIAKLHNYLHLFISSNELKSAHASNSPI